MLDPNADRAPLLIGFQKNRARLLWAVDELEGLPLLALLEAAQRCEGLLHGRGHDADGEPADVGHRLIEFSAQFVSDLGKQVRCSAQMREIGKLLHGGVRHRFSSRPAARWLLAI